METTKRPIYGLLKQIKDDEIRTEAITLASVLGMKTIGDLVGYSKRDLEKQEVSSSTLTVLEGILGSEYNVGFAEVGKPKSVPRRTSGRMPSGRSSSTETSYAGTPNCARLPRLGRIVIRYIVK